MHEDTDESDDSNPDRPASTDTSPTTAGHDWGQSDQASVAIVEAVAVATGRETSELPPLQRTIDGDALDTLLDSEPSSVVVSFRYADTDVWVGGDGSIDVQVDRHPREEADE